MMGRARKGGEDKVARYGNDTDVIRDGTRQHGVEYHLYEWVCG